MDPVIGIPIMFACLAFEAFFSGSEIGIISADRAKLLHEAENGSRGARLALEMLQKPEWLLSITLIGTNIAIVTNTTVATMLVVDAFGEGRGWLAAVIVAPLTWVFGEIVAKSAFQQNADIITPKVIGFIKLVSYVFFPLLLAFSFLTRLLARLSGKDESNPFTIREEITSLMQMKTMSGDIEPAEQNMIRRIFEFRNTAVDEVLVPLIDVIGVSHTATCGDVARTAAAHSFRRLTVYEDRVDNIVGVLDSLDVLGVDPNLPIEKFMAPARFVPGSQSIEELLVTLRDASLQMAVVVDEYGGAEGIVLIEDVLEQVVGEIVDEHDIAEPHQMVEKIGRHELRVNARIDVGELAETTAVHLPEGNYETLGGFLIDLAREIPTVGSTVRYRKYTFVIEQVSDRAIQQVSIRW